MNTDVLVGGLRFCPLLKGECLRNKCSWWWESFNRKVCDCAINIMIYNNNDKRRERLNNHVSLGPEELAEIEELAKVWGIYDHDHNPREELLQLIASERAKDARIKELKARVAELEAQAEKTLAAAQVKWLIRNHHATNEMEAVELLKMTGPAPGEGDKGYSEGRQRLGNK